MTVSQQQELILSSLLNTPLPSAEIRRRLGGISPATLSRLINGLGARIVMFGKARAVVYARLRDLRGLGNRFPVYRIGPDGNVGQIGILFSLLGGQFWWESLNGGKSRVYRHLPWFLQDMRPDGFMGRAFAHQLHEQFALPLRLQDWNDDDILYALLRRGDECIGDLIVGEEAVGRYLQHVGESPAPLAETDLAAEYPRLAQAAMAGGAPGSSAGGEQPKFCAVTKRDDGVIRHHLVKFSPPAGTEEGCRWADLLICEHIALNVLRDYGIDAAESRLLRIGERTFLEVERFDRCGGRGRLPVCSIGVVDDEMFGRRDSWRNAADRLEQVRALPREDAADIRRLSWFADLIANTDQHFGNISLVPQDADRSRFRLAPAYDMLPMLYAPRAGIGLPAHEFAPPAIAMAQHEVLPMAERFWEIAGGDRRISRGFRQICERNRARLTRARCGPKIANGKGAY